LVRSSSPQAIHAESSPAARKWMSEKCRRRFHPLPAAYFAPGPDSPSGSCESFDPRPGTPQLPQRATKAAIGASGLAWTFDVVGITLMRWWGACDTTARRGQSKRWMRPSPSRCAAAVIAVDTNVVVRLLTWDDAAQDVQAKALFQSNDIFLSKTFLLETEWVLRSLYGFERRRVGGALRGLVALRNLRSEDPASVIKALEWTEKGLGYVATWQRQWVALLSFSAAAWKCAVRARWIGRRHKRCCLGPSSKPPFAMEPPKTLFSAEQRVSMTRSNAPTSSRRSSRCWRSSTSNKGSRSPSMRCYSASFRRLSGRGPPGA